MDEEALRALVRQAVAKHLGGHDRDAAPIRPLTFLSDASHYRYVLPETDGACLIEPSVECVHCGYCQSHGH